MIEASDPEMATFIFLGLLAIMICSILLAKLKGSKMKRKKEPILPLATLDFKMPRKRWGTIGWFKGSIVQRIVRKIPEKWQHIYHDCGENILAEVLYLQTDKGSLKITSCNYCSLLHIKKDGILLFEDLDFQVEKKHE